MIEEYKFLSKGLLKEANKAAHREKRSRCINPQIFGKLPLDFIYYVEKVFYHRKNEVRIQVLMDEKGNTELLDMSFTRFLSLPIIKFSEDGKFEVEFPGRPYPNGREWQETEIKKPVRKQSKFRNEVLLKYNSTCSLCNIEEKSLLRAAHILGVSDGGQETINNGICMCVNHEVAFDRGIIKVLPNYEVIAPKGIGVIVEKLKLPNNKEDYPLAEFLKLKIELLKKN